jgi:hypothetical protein
MKITKINNATHFTKEYDWELFSSEEKNQNFCLWVDHSPKRNSIIKISSYFDPYECAELENEKQIDELIQRLQQAKEFFK